MGHDLLRQFADGTRGVFWLSLATLVATAWLALAGNPGQVLAALCGPSARPPDLLLAFVMWGTMSLAMMLPVAAPTLATYLDIADAARVKSIAVVPAGIIAAGYMTVWLGFSLLAAIVQVLLSGFERSNPVAGAVLVMAGLYQFAPLKRACLAKCRSPMSLFLGRWSERPLDVFKIGIEQGLSCLGCCWALMLLGFAAGAMNLAWMAAIGAVMILERMLPNPRPLALGVGLGLIGAGCAMIGGGG